MEATPPQRQENVSIVPMPKNGAVTMTGLKSVTVKTRTASQSSCIGHPHSYTRVVSLCESGLASDTWGVWERHGDSVPRSPACQQIGGGLCRHSLNMLNCTRYWWNKVSFVKSSRRLFVWGSSSFVCLFVCLFGASFPTTRWQEDVRLKLIAAFVRRC